MVTVERNLLTIAEGQRASFRTFGLETLPPKGVEPIDPEKIRNIAYSTLEENITPNGIYASSAAGPEGMYHGIFTRDGIIAASEVLEGTLAIARKLGDVPDEDMILLRDSITSIMALGEYQAKEDNSVIGAKIGQMTHEIRFDGFEHLTQPEDEEATPWYHDGEKLLSYDSVDATPGWAYLVGRFINLGLVEPNERELGQLRSTLEWTINNMRENGGLVGFTFDKKRGFGGLTKQNWMDSAHTMKHQDGSPEVYPLRPVEVQGMAWGAFKQAVPIFEHIDPEFAAQLHLAADALKDRFNGPEGFGMLDKEGSPYLAEAIDGNGRKVENVTCNPGLLLWASYGGETILNDSMQESVIKKLLSPEMFDPEAGIRTYSNTDTDVFFDPEEYHNGPETFWPHIDGMIAIGLDELGYEVEAEKVAQGPLPAMQRFNTAIELVIRRENGKLDSFRAASGQRSSMRQTFAAGAAYYAHHRFLS